MMKKITGLLLLICVLSGCLFSGEATRDTVLREERLVSESMLPETMVEEKETEKEELDVEGKLLSTEKKADLLRQQQHLYAFSTLPVTEQNLYVEMLYALTHYVEEMEVSTMETGEIDKIFQCVMLDHPEIFYADGYSFVKYTLGDRVEKITFSGTYNYTWEEKAAREALIEEKIAQIIQGIPQKASDYDKVKYVYEWVIGNTEYDKAAPDNQNICSVFLQSRSVCQGYAKAAQVLLQRVGIPATLVTGTVGNGEGHAWNLVRADNAWYYLDATWGDASYLFQSGEQTMGQKVPEINYDYLCVTTKELLRTHSFSDLIPLPDCQAMEDNYYVREGAWFQEADWKQLKTLVERYYSEGRETLTLKCANEGVYQEMINQLLGEQKIFDYLQPEGDSILYSDSARQMSITFWL